MKDCTHGPNRVSAFNPAPETETFTATSENEIRIWLVDDNDDVRLPLAELLAKQPRLNPERQFSSAEAVLASLSSHAAPNVILLDLNLGSESGIDAIAPIKAAAPKARVFILTTFFDMFSEAEALEAGATGFLLKSYEISQLTDFIHAGADGRPHPAFFSRTAARYARKRPRRATEPLICAARPGLGRKRLGFLRSLLTMLAI